MSDTVVEEIRRAADIVETISAVVPLKKIGNYYRGACPFHKESNPSFTVNPDSQTFYCFGCHEGGDVFSFYMKYHHLSFPEAVEELASRFGIPVRRFRGSERGEGSKDAALKRELYEINQWAASYYHRTLLHAEQGRAGRRYLERRGIDTAVIRAFRLGFAPPGWQNLINVFKEKGVSWTRAEQAGLIVQGKGDRRYDRFRNRIVFPIVDLQGRVVGFGGRVLDDSLPKYLNSPETPVYHKGRMLYGLATGLKEGRQAGRILLVEGYMDLLSLVAAGIRNVAASLGTAVTREQVRLLKRCGADVVLAFDSDEAGRKAAWRAAPLFLEEGVRAYVLRLDSGEDPDDCIRRAGKEAFLEKLDTAVPLVDFCLESVLNREFRDAGDKEEVIREIGPLVKSFRSEIQRLETVRKVASALELDERVVWSTLDARVGGPKALGDAAGGSRDVFVRKEEQILGMLIRNPGILRRVSWEDLVEAVRSEELRALLSSWFEIVEKEEAADVALLLARHPDETSKRTLARILSEFDTPGDQDAERIARDLIRTLRLKKIRKQERDLTDRIREAEQAGDTSLLLSLLRERKHLIEQKTQLSL